ncbi:MAG: hypothetical protein DHS20C13_15170 [Thermodesulfobacteriota bacterium]|nr:MAG: hypothetical protein DHS20C13_15170 [Thermodesulfobacteriota bacterium]
MGRIQLLDNNIWTVGSTHKFLGIDFGGRMTVIRLKSGNLILHSPVIFESILVEELNEIGIVKYIVAPNKFHHLHIDEYISCYPEAEVWCAPGLSKKRKDISFHAELRDESPPEWVGEIETVFVEGIPFFNEIVFYHPKSQTVIFTDLIFNYNTYKSIGIKFFAWLEGIYRRPDVSRLIKWFMIRDKNATRKSLKKILAWDFDRVSLTHKDIIESGGKEIVAKAFESI